ncbi:hypothetical protein F5Y18DRAFT_445008 [Xylariaceae sp. FL1019]|nr:hypothetical protein F5Y18DRAFT_445008 [Xylariaceae sp. FL1019]
MWTLKYWQSKYKLDFADGEPLETIRGGHGTSSRLVVDTLGFIDITEADISAQTTILDANGSRLAYLSATEQPKDVIKLSLKVVGADDFTLSYSSHDSHQTHVTEGQFKPFPSIRPDDCAYIRDMIRSGYIPYPSMPKGKGKTKDEIKELSSRLFPFTNANYELGMAVHDWTTASFTRMVLFKIFEYTSYPEQGQQANPLDQHSIAEQIWLSNWDSFIPQNPSFMRSFMMKPAWSQLEVELQLIKNGDALRQFSDIENRLLSAAMQALPRTSVVKCPILFSGQVDIRQLGTDHFGIEFLEHPFNEGPISRPLVEPFTDTLSRLSAEGRTLTTKAVTSFTDTVERALHYSNGILLSVTQQGDSLVWDRASHITPLSDDANKIEYTFLPGTKFHIRSIDEVTFVGKPVVVLNLFVVATNGSRPGSTTLPATINTLTNRPQYFETDQKLLHAQKKPTRPPHSIHNTGGRWCECYTV